MWRSMKSASVVVMTVGLMVGCTNSEQPGKTSDGVNPYDREKSSSIFGRNSQISNEVEKGKLNDNVKWDTPVANAPTDKLDVSGTTAESGRGLTNATNKSVFGTTEEADSNNALQAKLHQADGRGTISKGNSINWTNHENTVSRAQSELNRRGYKVMVNGVIDAPTKNAVLRFQKDNGLEQTGQLTETTLNALNVTETDDGRAPASVEE